MYFSTNPLFIFHLKAFFFYDLLGFNVYFQFLRKHLSSYIRVLQPPSSRMPWLMAMLTTMMMLLMMMMTIMLIIILPSLAIITNLVKSDIPTNQPTIDINNYLASGRPIFVWLEVWLDPIVFPASKRQRNTTQPTHQFCCSTKYDMKNKQQCPAEQSHGQRKKMLSMAKSSRPRQGRLNVFNHNVRLTTRGSRKSNDETEKKNANENNEETNGQIVLLANMELFEWLKSRHNTPIEIHFLFCKICEILTLNF